MWPFKKKPKTTTRLFIRERCVCGAAAWVPSVFADTVICHSCGRDRVYLGVENPVVEYRREVDDASKNGEG